MLNTEAHRGHRRQAFLRYEAAARSGKYTNAQLEELYFAATAGVAAKELVTRDQKSR